MIQAFPVSWLIRIGSIQELPCFTFMNTLTCWMFTRGKATTYLKYQRGLRQFSHDDKVKPYLELRAERMRQRLAQGPPHTIPGKHVHALGYLDNFLRFLNLTEERKQRTADSEMHATIIGYRVPLQAAALEMLPKKPKPQPAWFEASETELTALIAKRDAALNAHHLQQVVAGCDPLRPLRHCACAGSA